MASNSSKNDDVGAPPPEYYVKVPSNTAALPRSRAAPEKSAATFGSCDWSKGVDMKPMCGVCPRGWECNEYSLLCEHPNQKHSCAPKDFHLA